VVMMEPVLTYAVVGLLKKVEDKDLVRKLFVVDRLTTTA